jgi:hypothetical protein
MCSSFNEPNGYPGMASTVLEAIDSDRRLQNQRQPYGHLAPSYTADAILAGAPKFAFKPNPKIASFAGKATP